MRIELNLDQIHKFLIQQDVAAILNRENKQISFAVTIKEQQLPLILSIPNGDMMVQLILYLPFTLKENNYNEVARLLHFVNKEIDMPGFGMDEKSKLVFYRLLLLCADKKVDTHLLEIYVSTTRLVCETFMGAIAEAVEGLKAKGQSPKNPPL